MTADDRYGSAAEMRQALERLHVREDWVRRSPESWEAEIDGRMHTMQVESGKIIETVYRVNGRRRNDNCSKAGSVGEAIAAQERWVYSHTF